MAETMPVASLLRTHSHTHNRFLIADFTKDLEEFAETFDIVHCRCVAGHVRTNLFFLFIIILFSPSGLLPTYPRFLIFNFLPSPSLIALCLSNKLFVIKVIDRTGLLRQIAKLLKPGTFLFINSHIYNLIPSEKKNN